MLDTVAEPFYDVNTLTEIHTTQMTVYSDCRGWQHKETTRDCKSEEPNA